MCIVELIKLIKLSDPLSAGEMAELPTMSAQQSRSYAYVVKTQCPSLTLGVVIIVVANTTSTPATTTPAATDNALATVMETNAGASVGDAAASGLAEMQTSHR